MYANKAFNFAILLYVFNLVCLLIRLFLFDLQLLYYTSSMAGIAPMFVMVYIGHDVCLHFSPQIVRLPSKK